MPNRSEMAEMFGNPAQAPQPPLQMDFAALLAAMQQNQAQQPNLAILAQLLNQPRGRHFGIGGAEITPENPMGNLGGDPFANGFFQRGNMTPGVQFLSSPHPDADQMAMLHAAQPNNLMAPPQLPPGDPIARAFFNKPSTDPIVPFGTTPQYPPFSFGVQTPPVTPKPTPRKAKRPTFSF